MKHTGRPTALVAAGGEAEVGKFMERRQRGSRPCPKASPRESRKSARSVNASGSVSGFRYSAISVLNPQPPIVRLPDPMRARSSPSCDASIVIFG